VCAVTRNVRTYDHFCLVARALERVGDRWSLLVIRDLLTGAERFTDLMDPLGGITPETLSTRLRELDDAGIVAADREPGRREVFYRMTPAGADLGPVIDALSWWGLQHEWRWPQAGEPVHAEHLLRTVTQAIGRTEDDHEPATLALPARRRRLPGRKRRPPVVPHRRGPARTGRRHDHRDHPGPGHLHLRPPGP
jgi:DNA-binding HxlR family transcriptional regulator